MNKDLYLLDEQFLNEMAEQKQRDIYARIISLDINENPIEQIEGKITTGSINIDGDSAVRRTCSLTMVSQEVNITDYYWGVKTKFKLEIGLKNKINKDYPDIIWYPQGIYVITTFNTSFSTNNCTISIQGKDKMCLLNGDVSGQMYASIDFGTEEVIKTEMNIVDFSYAVNSQQIMSQAIQKYYICDFNEFDNIPSIIKKNNPDYIFIKKTKNENNVKTYSYNQSKEQYEHDSNDNNKEYILYKIIKEPDEIFKSIDNNTYEPNKYYIQQTDSSSYYNIDTNESQQNRTHYQLKNIYSKNDNLTKEKIPIGKIIREAVHTYGKEPYHNIIINDLDSYGLEQLTYKGEEPLYALYDTSYGPYAGSEEYTNLILKNMNENFDTIIDKDNFVFKELNSTINQTDATKILVFNNEFQGEIKETKEINDITYIGYKPINLQSNTIYYCTEGQNVQVINGLNSFTDVTPRKESSNIKVYTVVKFEYGDDIGYRLTDLIYTGDLISNVGDSLTSILDKIKTMLGDFEYFYDLEGKFVFYKKKTYINTSWNTMIDNNDEKYFTFANDESKFSFNFEGNRLISAIQNSPKITNLRNDFSVWGKRKSSSGSDINIHIRYAIDKKPIYYKALDGKIYITNYLQKIDRSEDYPQCFNKKWLHIKDFINLLNLLNLNPKLTEKIIKYKPNENNMPSREEIFWPDGDSSLDEYISVPDSIRNEYILNKNIKIWFIKISKDFWTLDINYNLENITIEELMEDTQFDYYIYINYVDWREIIYQMALDYFAGQGCSNDNPVFLSGVTSENNYLKDPDQFLYEVGKRNPEYYPTGYTGYEQYYTDMQGFWRQLYNPEYVPKVEYENGHYDGKNWIGSKVKEIIYEYYSTSDSDYSNVDLNKLYWNKIVFESPETLNFWIDFLDSNLELSKFSVPQIGDRSKTIKDDKVGAIVYKEIPNLILYEPKYTDPEEERQYKSDWKKIIEQRAEVINKSGYRFINLSKGFSQFFTISYRFKSAKDKIDDLLYEHTYAQDSITITSIPIYHLEPNTIIYVKDDNTGINGEYIATRFTIPLNYNGTMSITANKAPERIY